MNKKQNKRGFSTQIRKIYVNEDNTLNRFALFLSGLAIALIILLLINFKSFLLSANHAEASENSYSGEIQEIYDYINSIDGFTPEQRQALNTILKDYFENSDAISQEDLAPIYELINNKQLSTNEFITQLKLTLEQQINNVSSDDSAHYNELLALISQLNQLIAANKKADEDGRNDISDAIDDMATKTKNNEEKIWEAIRILNQRTTDLEGQYEFDFGYQDGCYGYYVDGSFKCF